MADTEIIDEATRLSALDACGIMHTPREAAFDSIVFTIAQLFRVPMAVLTLVSDSHVWAKAAVGVKLTMYPRPQTFCNFVVSDRQLLVVEDAYADPRFASFPGVSDEPKIRFCAAAPLIGPGTHVIGALCVMDRVPRNVSDRQRAQLLQMARQAGELLRMRVPDIDLDRTG